MKKKKSYVIRLIFYTTYKNSDGIRKYTNFDEIFLKRNFDIFHIVS